MVGDMRQPSCPYEVRLFTSSPGTAPIYMSAKLEVFQLLQHTLVCDAPGVVVGVGVDRVPLLSPTQLVSLEYKKKVCSFSFLELLEGWLLSAFPISAVTLIFMAVSQLCRS